MNKSLLSVRIIMTAGILTCTNMAVAEISGNTAADSRELPMYKIPNLAENSEANYGNACIKKPRWPKPTGF